MSEVLHSLAARPDVVEWCAVYQDDIVFQVMIPEEGTDAQIVEAISNTMSQVKDSLRPMRLRLKESNTELYSPR